MTDKYVLFGNPVAHSMSPALHAFFAKETNQDLEYGRVLVEDGCFNQCADKFFKNGGLGCNITVPCKLDAFSYADNLTEYAKAAGAVNTLKKMPDGSILGDNTDGRGLVYDLNRLGCPLKDAHVLIIGAGGAAKGILKPIIESGIKKITIVNRTVSKALDLAVFYPGIVDGTSYENLTGPYDVIINATSLSLKNELPNIADSILSKASFVYDLMYRPDGHTCFTDIVSSLGVKAYDGFGMLVGQAILSFELWRNVKPNFDTAIKKFR